MQANLQEMSVLYQNCGKIEQATILSDGCLRNNGKDTLKG